MKASRAARLLFAGLAAMGVAVALAAPSAIHARQRAPVTFSDDVAPLLFDRCGKCHHPDGPAPFSLLSYEDARSRARLIADVTTRRLMPPWKTEPGTQAFVGQQPLSGAEIAMIQEWVRSGTPAGDLRNLPTPKWDQGWQLGQPDLVLTVPEPYVLGAEGGDVWRIFVLPASTGVLRYVRGLEFRPGNAGVVHHARIRLDSTPASRALDAQDPAPGYKGLLLRSAVYPDGHFLGWTPGQAGPLVPDGLAWPLPPGADLVIELHMVPSGKPERVAPSIGLYFSPEPPRQVPAILRLGRQNLEIAPGEKEYVADDSFVLPVPAQVLAVQPHAHFRGRMVRASARLPDGTTTVLLHINDWDVRWQHYYQFVRPVTLPAGTRLSMRFTFDNSSENPRNPLLPPQRVFWGEEATSEMGELWVQLLTEDDRQLRLLNAAIQPKMAAEDAVGYETKLRQDPSRVQLHDEAGDVYLYLGRPADAIRHFTASLERRPDSAAAHYNLGIALSEAGRLEEAIVRFRRAIELRPDYARAHNNLGSALTRAGRWDEALGSYRHAIRLDAGDADALYNAGSVLRAKGEFAEAVSYFRRAVQLRSNWLPAVASLAWLLAASPLQDVREPAEAIALGERAAGLSERRDAGVLDILAAAYASAARFDRAAAIVAEALALKPPEQVAAALRQRQALYLAGTPYLLPLVRVP